MTPAGNAIDFTGAARVLVFGGILLLATGMLFGEVFAIFISHVANGEIRLRWNDVVDAVAAADAQAATAAFDRIDVLLERRGRVMNTHSHLGAFGLLALGLALVQDRLAWSRRTRLVLAWMLVAGALVQPLAVFTSAYTGDWAHRVADAGAALAIAALLGIGAGLLRGPAAPPPALVDTGSGRLLLRGGAVLIVLGMLFGLGFAGVLLYRLEPSQFDLIGAVLDGAAADPAAAKAQVQEYRTLQSKMAILTAAHSHAIEMGLIAVLLACVQRCVLWSEAWRRGWAWAYLAGAFALPVFIFNATIFGLRSAAGADLAGALALVAMAAMLAGVIRRTGVDDAAVAGRVP